LTATRCHPDNALAHCPGCHGKLGGGRYTSGNPAKFNRHYKDIFSEKSEEAMFRLSNEKFTIKKHLLDISRHYRSEYKIMLLAIKRNPHAKRIEFKPWMKCGKYSDAYDKIINHLNLKAE
jgi:hypothetical protein